MSLGTAATYDEFVGLFVVLAVHPMVFVDLAEDLLVVARLEVVFEDAICGHDEEIHLVLEAAAVVPAAVDIAIRLVERRDARRRVRVEVDIEHLPVRRDVELPIQRDHVLGPGVEVGDFDLVVVVLRVDGDDPVVFIVLGFQGS